MNWNDVKIAYVPYSKNLMSPGDRRRFAFYANERQIKYELADPKNIYDIVYLTYGCDLSAWIAYKKKNQSVKIVFELIDSYLFEDDSLLMKSHMSKKIQTALKGFIRYAIGRESKFFFNYKSALLQMISISDAVVCSTDLQRNDLLKLNNNVHISLDYFSDDITTHKKTHKVGSKIKLVWEGQPYTASNLVLLNEVLKKIKNNVEVYVITDATANYYFNLYKVKITKILKEFKFNYHFIPWDKENISNIIASCDLAVIPIVPGDDFVWNKPENKLLFFWEIGIPTLTSNTPAYKRVMDIAGLDFYCSSSNEWLNKIQNFSNSSESYKQNIVDISSRYISKFHSKEGVLKKWDLIFESLQEGL